MVCLPSLENLGLMQSAALRHNTWDKQNSQHEGRVKGKKYEIGKRKTIGAGFNVLEIPATNLASLLTLATSLVSFSVVGSLA